MEFVAIIKKKGRDWTIEKCSVLKLRNRTILIFVKTVENLVRNYLLNHLWDE